MNPEAEDDRPMATAEVVTLLDDPDLRSLDDCDVAHANRWSVWGRLRYLEPAPTARPQVHVNADGELADLAEAAPPGGRER